MVSSCLFTECKCPYIWKARQFCQCHQLPRHLRTCYRCNNLNSSFLFKPIANSNTVKGVLQMGGFSKAFLFQVSFQLVLNVLLTDGMFHSLHWSPVLLENYRHKRETDSVMKWSAFHPFYLNHVLIYYCALVKCKTITVYVLPPTFYSQVNV